MTTDARGEGLAPLRQRAREQTPIWFAFFGGAAAWGVRIGGSYLAVPQVCRTQQVVLLHAIALLTLVVAVGAAWVGYRVYRDARTRRAAGSPSDDRPERTEFLGLTGCLLSAFFAGVILLESSANLVVDPCLAAQVR